MVHSLRSWKEKWASPVAFWRTPREDLKSLRENPSLILRGSSAVKKKEPEKNNPSDNSGYTSGDRSSLLKAEAYN